MSRRFWDEIDGLDEVIDDPADWTPPHGIDRIYSDGPVIDGFFDRERGDE